MDHTFSICAYGESPYLENCIRSVLKQSVASRIIICTSTPNDYIKGLVKKYELPYFIRDGESGIQKDWNYAYNMADTEYVTVTHQDDIYHRDYLKNLGEYTERYKDTLIVMTDYKIIDQNQMVREDVSLLIKKILLLPLRWSVLADKGVVKKGVQSLGNAICCPSVCYHKTMLGDSIFRSKFKYALDWETFYQLSGCSGRFTYIPKSLFYYRIHDDATTKKCLINQEKSQEEMAMFRKFWPEWMVKVLMKFYKISYKSYEK